MIQKRPLDFGGKPYRSLDFQLKQRYGEKIYKVSLNGGMTCPNRDGTLGTRGCIFCSEGGSGDFSADPKLSVTEQIEAQKQLLCRKFPVRHFIAYFQAYTNTYAPLPFLEHLFLEAINHPDIVGLSIATRPDCLPKDTLQLLADLNRIKPVTVELGLQTIHDKTAAFLRRGYSTDCFLDAVRRLQAYGLETVVHTIIGLPGEGPQELFATMRCLNDCNVQGVKLQLLHILKHTDLADYYALSGFHVLEEAEYVDLVIRCLELLSPDITIHRLTGDGPKDLLIAPLWSRRKRAVLNHIHQELRIRGTWQGRLYCG